MLIPVGMLGNFEAGMDRRLHSWLSPPPPVPFGKGPKWTALNLGAGRKEIEDTLPLDADRGWLAGEPFSDSGQVIEDETIRVIFAYHFLEHLTKEEILSVLRECERVLVLHGIVNIVVPHWSAEIAHQDLDHKSFFSEQTWKNLFDNPYYDGTMPRDWSLREQCSVIMGLVQRNLVLVSQLVKHA